MQTELLATRPQDRRQGRLDPHELDDQTNRLTPHPGPLPFEGRGRTAAAVSSVDPPAAVHSTPDWTTPLRTLEHRDLRRDDFWTAIPAYAAVGASEFHTHSFQSRQTVTNVRQLRDTLGSLVPDAFYEDVLEGLKHAPMALRISSYLLSLIDWSAPYDDPIRTQFLPLGSQQVPNHPELRLDSLHEQKDSPVPGLTHRYPDKALFLQLDSCPVY